MEAPEPRRWTREEFYRAAELGIFRPDEHLELIRGEIIKKMTQNPPHAIALVKVIQALTMVFGVGCHLRSQSPLHISNDTDPEPDVLVVNGSPDDYTDHPTPADVRLLVEISDSTLTFDRRDKGALYAHADIADYWILNLQARVLEVYRDPGVLPHAPFGYGFKTVTIYTEADNVSPLASPGAAIRVVDLFPGPAGS